MKFASRLSAAAARAASLLSIGVVAVGAVLAAVRFPDGFDWAYTVMSALASRKHNPESAPVFAAALALSFALLWPAVGWLGAQSGWRGRLTRFGVRSLRVGVAAGMAVGVERLVFQHLSDTVPKGHEIIALISFLGMYLGVIALYVDRLRASSGSGWPALLVIAPLVAIGVSQLGLYLDQRDLGWVDRDWRAMGIPVWWSFAFWQWLAAAALWLSIAHLVVTTPPGRPDPGDQPRGFETGTDSRSD